MGQVLNRRSDNQHRPAPEDQTCSKEQSADKKEQLAMPIRKNGSFENPWETWRKPGFLDFLIMRTKTPKESKIPSQEELDQTLPINTPEITEFERPLQSGVRVMWVGHATVVAQLDDFTFITDPVFSERASLVQQLRLKRYRDPACSVAQLPKLNAVVISHNHYDHLHLASVVALNERFGRELQWFVPMGLKSWMNSVGCENVVEMTWWEEREVEGTRGVRVACTPCQHWCRRFVADYNTVLWSSWCILGPKHSFHFAGDTGYCPGFEQIGRKYGPFTAAAIPIGSYHPRWFMGPQHVDPNQAVDIHCDIKSRQSLGIHWGTFSMGCEHYLEPRSLLEEAIRERQMLPESFITIEHGDIVTLGAET